MPNAPVLGVRMTNYYAVRRELERAHRLRRGAFRDSIKYMLEVMKNYAQYITHRESGALARSHRVYYDPHLMSGYVYPKETFYHVRYPGKVQYAYQYAAWEHSRGGDHAFYARAIQEVGPKVATDGIKVWFDALGMRRSIT